jgi:6-phosphogluconolactonase
MDRLSYQPALGARMTRPDVIVAPPDVLARTLAVRVAAVCRAAVEARGTANVALTGGSAFRALARSLPDADIPWEQVRLFWSDERAVPEDHPDSNLRLAREVLIDRVPIPATHVHPMRADIVDLDEAALMYEAVLRESLGEGTRFDMLMTGVGSDGHVCSLFPQHPLLSERTRLVAAVHDSPKPPPRRLTLTLPVIEAAQVVIVLALGADKAEAVGDAMVNDASRLPLARVVRAARSVWCLLDSSAAARLDGW